MHLPGAAVPADTTELHIDDLAGAQFDGGSCVSIIINTFVETDRRTDPALQTSMGINVVPIQRLFDHQQAEFVKLT